MPAATICAGKATEPAREISIDTVEPARSFVLTTGPDVVLAAGSGAEATLTLPAEALVRLVYGRLDPDHTPAEVSDEEQVAQLRSVFPGF